MHMHVAMAMAVTVLPPFTMLSAIRWDLLTAKVAFNITPANATRFSRWEVRLRRRHS